MYYFLGALFFLFIWKYLKVGAGVSTPSPQPQPAKNYDPWRNGHSTYAVKFRTQLEAWAKTLGTSYFNYDDREGCLKIFTHKDGLVAKVKVTGEFGCVSEVVLTEMIVLTDEQHKAFLDIFALEAQRHCQAYRVLFYRVSLIDKWERPR